MTQYFQDLFTKNEQDSRIIYKSNHQQYTLIELKTAINILAHSIKTQETSGNSGQRWLIATENHFWFTASLFALLYLAKTPVILGHHQASRIIEQAPEFDGVIGESALQKKIAYHLPEQLFIALPTQKEMINDNKTHTSKRGFLSRESCQQFTIDETLLIQSIENINIHIFTSGSSGAPQKICKPFSILATESALLYETFYAEIQNSHFISTVSPLHQYGISFAILLPLRAGVSSNIHAISYQEELATYQDELQITLITSPAFLKRLDLSLQYKSNINTIFSAGGPLSYKDIEDTFSAFNTMPIEIYGSSETCVVAYQNYRKDYFNHLSSNNISCSSHPLFKGFKPFKKVLISENDDNTISVNSPLILEGTISLSDKIRIENNTFFLLGRNDKIIKIEEKRVSITDIEQRIENIIANSKVFIVPLTQGNRIILGAVIITTNTPPHHSLPTFSRKIAQKLREHIEPVAIPRKWRFIDHYPMNTQGKVTQQSLEVLFNEYP